MTKKFWLFYVKSQLPLIIFYVLIFSLLLIMNYAYKLPNYFIGDVFRYSISGLLIWLIVKLLFDLNRTHQFIKNDYLEKYQINTPIENVILTKIKQQKLELENKLNSKNLEQKDRINQMDLSAHEIKNDLTSLQINLENKNQDNNEMLDAVNDANYQLDMLLNYEKLFSISNDFKFEWIHLDDLVEKVLKNMSMQFINKQLIPELSNLHIFVLSDKKWMNFCIEQLLSNATKYAYDGTKIQIIFSDGSLTIVNSGNPIEPSDMPRIFEKGFTGSNGHNNRLSTGLGLFLVKNICNKININIEAKSYNNQNEFTLMFQKTMLKK